MASGKLSETLNWYSSCKIASLMILRSSRILLEVLAGLLFVLVLLGAGAAWRLSQGPVSLAFAIPYVDEQLVKAGGPFAIELVDIILIWGGWDRTLDIRVVGVTARDRGGGVIAAIPEVSVGLAAVALAGGKISLTRFELIEPLMRAHRTESGEFELVIGERTGPTGNTLPMLFQALLNMLFQALEPSRAGIATRRSQPNQCRWRQASCRRPHAPHDLAGPRRRHRLDA